MCLVVRECICRTFLSLKKILLDSAGVDVMWESDRQGNFSLKDLCGIMTWGHVGSYCQRFWFDGYHGSLFFNKYPRWLWYRCVNITLRKINVGSVGKAQQSDSELLPKWHLGAWAYQIWFGERRVLVLYLCLKSYGAFYTHYVHKDTLKIIVNMCHMYLNTWKGYW